MRSNALKTAESDNVAVAIQRIPKGAPVVVGGEALVEAAEDIDLGHKVALVPLASGSIVIRYGEPIVQATRDIPRGGWVHVHNTQPVPGDLKE